MATFPANSDTPLVLASTSTARKALLVQAGLVVDAEPPGVDEADVKADLRAEGARPHDIARVLAEMKARAVSLRRTGAVVIGGDQVLSLEGRVFDKPATPAEGRQHLDVLRGQTHTLISAVAVYRDDQRLWSTTETVKLTMRPVDDAFLDAYCAAMGDDIVETVGGYKLEGLGVHLFDRIDGDYFTVLGLPLLALLGYLRQYGVIRT